MRLLFLLIIGLLAILPLYSEETDTDEDDTGENDAIEQPEPDTPRGYRREGGDWASFFSANIGFSDRKDYNFIAGLDITRMYVLYGGFLYNMHTFGLDYQNLVIDDNSQSIIRMGYTYSRHFTALGAGVGMSGFYNIDNNNIGIAPKISVIGLIPYGFFNRFFLMLNFYYRYNLVLNNVKDSYFEFVSSLSVNISLDRDN